MNYKNLLLSLLPLLLSTVFISTMQPDKPIYEIIAEKNFEKWKPKSNSEKNINNLIAIYKGYEERLLRGEKPQSTLDLPDYMNYTMPLEQIKKKIKEKFDDMHNEGQIIFQSDFDGIENQYGNKVNFDLKKIHGSNYLKSYLQNSNQLKEHYAVAPYIIVIPDKTQAIEIGISCASHQMLAVNFLTPIIDGEKEYLHNINLYFKSNDGQQVEENDPGMKELTTGLKQINRERLLYFADITKENEKYYISNNMLSYSYCESKDCVVYNSHKSKNCANCDFEKYIHERFLYHHPSTNILASHHYRFFKYDLPPKVSEKSVLPSEASQQDKPTTVNESFYEKLYKLIGRNRLFSLCIGTGTGIILYWIISYTLSHSIAH